MGNPQKYFVKATYDFDTDTGDTGARTLAITDNVPKGATITDVIIEKLTNAASGGSATVVVTAGGVTCTGSISLGSLGGGAGYVTDANVGRLYIDTTSNAAIGITIGTAALTAGKFNITVGYLQ
tara:strand:- start:234 stop:605 length:372 start_codon:yes stop_codon:yes gene_type:complete